jgi:AcrR family transcriptional regulator
MTPRPPRPELRDRKARAIVEAAAQVFAESGLQAARMADVAERAGIGKGTVYEYFRSKEELFLAVFEAFGVGTLDAVVTRLEPGPASAVAFLREFTRITLATCQEALYLYPLTMEFWSAAATAEFRGRLMEDFRRLYAGYREVIAGAIRKGQTAGEFGSHVQPDLLAAALVGAMDALFLQAWFDPGFDAVAAGTHFVDVTLRGMAPPPAARHKNAKAKGGMRQ